MLGKFESVFQGGWLTGVCWEGCRLSARSHTLIFQRCDVPHREENIPATILIVIFVPRTIEKAQFPNSLRGRRVDKKFHLNVSEGQSRRNIVWEGAPLRMRLFFPSRRTELAHKRHPIITQMSKKSYAGGSRASSDTNGNLLNQSLMGIMGAGSGEWVLGHVGTHLEEGIPGG